MGSIRAKLAALAGSVAALAVLAALSVLFAASASERALEAAVDAQRRLDLLTEVSARLSEFGLVAVADADHPTSDRSRIAAARLRAARTLETVAAIPETGEPMPGRGRLLAHLKADFTTLDRQIGTARADADAGRRADSVRGALNAFAASAGPTLSALVETERRAVSDARAEAGALSARLKAGAAALAVAVLAAALVLYRALAQPLLGRLAQIDRAAAAIGHGVLDTRLSIGSRDELGLLMAKFNRMAARLARREQRVAQDRAMLERTVDERTADLTAANARLAAIDASRRRFFADVSHELRTPLTVIIGECDVTQRAPRVPEDLARGVLATIRKRAGRLNRRVEDLLRVARSESGEIELVFQDLPLAPLLADAASNFETLAQRAGVALAVSVAEPDPVVHADREWLRQVVEGLIDNALRHGGRVTRIAVSARVRDDAVEITVEDDGDGIPPEARQALFTRFARGAGPRAGAGFGVGLALADWVVTRHGGRITLADDEGCGERARGTRVVIILPRPTAGMVAALGSGDTP